MKILTEIPPVIENPELMVAMDFEMYGQKKGHLHRPIGTFACLSVCIEGNPKIVYQIYDEKDVPKVIRAVCRGVWVFHNSLYDLRQIERYTPHLERIHGKDKFIWDTMLLDQSMNGGYYKDYSLRDLARRWLGELMEKEVRDDFETATEMTPTMRKYAARDAEKTLKIALLQRNIYPKSPAFKAYKEIDEPCIWPVLDMPGIRVDTDKWAKMVDGFAKRAREIEDELGINTYSNNQVFSATGKVGIHLKNNQAATLEAFAGNPLIDKIIEAKMLRKAASSYGRDWLEEWVESDGKIYASYHINGTETYRFSCSNPPMQTIPQRKLPIYRTAFVPSVGNIMSVWDIKQQEPCILAYESGDEELLKAIKSGEDLHLSVARIVFNNPKLTAKDKEKRFVGKTINLGTSYGLTEFGLSTRLHITEQEAANFLRIYFQRFKDVFLWAGRQRTFALQYGYVKTAGGHRIYINPYDNQHDNNAVNAPIQGGAAEFTKRWIRNYWELCRKGFTFGLCASVHDEIVRDIPRDEITENDKINKEAFETTAEALFPGIPFTYEAERGKSWAVKSVSNEMEVDDGE